MTLYELAPGDEMVFHYHVQREELLIVLTGRLSLRTAAGWEELPEGEVAAFPRGERGAHGYRNDTDRPVRLLMISEMNAPNISVYPDTNQVGIFDAGRRAERRFGALFNVADAVSDYGGSAQIVPPAPGPRHEDATEATRDGRTFWDEGPDGVVGGAIWDEPERWQALVDGRECPICVRGAPLGVLVERSASWITSGDRIPVKGYVCVVAKRHVLEPYELPSDERREFWEDVLFAAERVARLLHPMKVNYEIHGNSLPHLHAHIYPRFRGDRFVGGPIDARVEPVTHVPEELEQLRNALL